MKKISGHLVSTIAVLLTVCISSPLLAIDGKTVLTVLDSTETTVTLSAMLKDFDILEAKATGKRKAFENLNTYEGRISAANKKFDEFLKRRYTASFHPDSTMLDWANAMLAIKLEFPSPVQRPRGDEKALKEIIIKVPGDPDQIREYHTFSDKLNLQLNLHISKQKVLILEEIRVSYRGKEVLVEK